MSRAMGPIPTPSSASMQSRFATDKTAVRSSTSSVLHTEGLRKSTPYSRYRLLDDEEQRQEAKAVQRIIRDLKSQRQSKAESSRNSNTAAQHGASSPRSASSDASRSRRNSTTKAAFEAFFRPEASASPTMKTRRAQSRHGYDQTRQSNAPDELPLDSPEPRSPRHQAIGGDASSSFQSQVLEELRRLKEAQRRDLEAIEALKFQKEQAEERARRLAMKLQQGNARSASSKTTSKEILLEEHLDDHASDHGVTVYDNNRMPVDDCEGRDESAPTWATAVNDDLDDQPPDYADDEDGEDFDRAAPVALFDSTSPPKWSARCTTSAPSASPTTSPWYISARGRKNGAAWSPSASRSRSRPSTPSRVRGYSRSPSRGRSSSSTTQHRRTRGSSVGHTSMDLIASRRSCAFFDEKERQRLEEEQREREAAQRIARAAKASPPKQLLKHQEAARREKEQQLRQLQREMNAELSKDKRVKARDVPLTTYMPISMTDGREAGGVNTEAHRSERIRKRSQDLLQAVALPPRMASATAAPSDPTEPLRMTIKMKKKLMEAAQQEAERQSRRPKPVPNFDRLHRQWGKMLAQKRAKQARVSSRDDENDAQGDQEAVQPKGATVCKEFFVSRAEKLEELRVRKEARRRKLLAEEQERLRLEKEKQEKLLQRIKKENAAGVSSKSVATKTEQLRVQKLLADAAEAEKRRQREQQEADARERKLREASRRVAAQVKQAEARRRDEYSGTFVELPTDPVSAKAKESRQQFKEAMRRNREKLLAAVALKPSLMERFTTDVKREEHKRAALEAVVTNVFRGDTAAMKGVLTDEEQELALELVAAKGGDEE